MCTRYQVGLLTARLINSRPRRLLTNYETRFSTFGVLGVPEIDLVLDALGAGTVLEFLECQEHGEGLAVGVGRIEHDEGETELIAEFFSEVVLALGRAKEEARKSGILDRLFGGLHLDEHDLLEMTGQGGLINQLCRLREHDRVETLRPVEFGVA